LETEESAKKIYRQIGLCALQAMTGLKIFELELKTSNSSEIEKILKSTEKDFPTTSANLQYIIWNLIFNVE